MSSLIPNKNYPTISFDKLVEMIEKWKIISNKDSYSTRCNKKDHVTIIDMEKKLFAHGGCNCY